MLNKLPVTVAAVCPVQLSLLRSKDREFERTAKQTVTSRVVTLQICGISNFWVK